MPKLTELNSKNQDPYSNQACLKARIETWKKKSVKLKMLKIISKFYKDNFII